MKRIAILASGNGSNAEVIANYFSQREDISVELIMTNKKDSGVIGRAERLGIPYTVFTKEELNNGSVEAVLASKPIDFIILAGFLLKVPDELVRSFSKRIINIHPSLLPKYGGKGMYGERVHKAVIEAGEKVSGISIHLVNEVYDDGKILFQDTVEVSSDETSDSLAQKIHALEHKHFPEQIERYILGFN